MSEEQKGIQETKEVMVGFIKLAAMLAHEFKDGIQAQDIMPIIAKLQSEPLKSEMIKAYNGIDQVPSEVKDISLAEALSLIPEVLEATKELIAAIKK